MGDTLSGAAGAATPGTDFSPASGTITFAPGETTKTVTLAIAADGAVEGLEGLKFSLLNSSNQIVSSKTVNITDKTDAGQSFPPLTTGTDTINGTAGDDTIIAVVDYASGYTAGAASTLNNGDKIVGNGGNDTLSITAQNAAAAVAAVTAVAQRSYYTFGVPNAATDVLVVNVGGSSVPVVTGAGANDVATAYAAALNGQGLTAEVGTIAGGVFTVDAVAGVSVRVTAPVAGTPLPSISFTSATHVSNYPAVNSAITATANVVGVSASPAVALPAADISSVETINVRNITVGTVNVDADNFSGATAINSDRSTSKVAVTNLATGASVGVIGNGTVTNGALDFAYKTASSAVTLNIAGGTTGGPITNTAGTATAATINSTGASNTVGAINLAAGNTVTGLTINAATSLSTGTISGFKGAVTDNTITVSGAASAVPTGQTAAVNIGTLDTTVGTVNASGLTAGGISAALSAVGQKITGGQGNDTITTNSIVLTTGSVDAGAGTADRLIVSAAADIAATPAAKYTGFEILRNGTATNLDVSTVSGINAIELGLNGAGATKMNATQAAAVTNLLDNASATLALTTATGTADVLTVTLKNATSTTSADLTNVTVTGFETMNVVSSSGTKGNSTPGNDLSFAAAGDLTALNISGEYDLAIATANLTKGVAITSSQTGSAVLNVSGNLVKGSSVTTTGNADTITVTAAVAGSTGDFVTYNAGAGNDAISATVAAINNTSGANASVKIDGGTGTDTLTLTGTTLTMVDANFQYLTGIEKFVHSDAGAITITTGGFFDTNNKAAGAEFTLTTTGTVANTVDVNTFTGNAKITLTANSATTHDQVIATGSGNDTVTFSGTGLTTGDLTLSTGAGNDTISVTLHASNLAAGAVIVINGGAGQDSITLSGATVGNDAAKYVSLAFQAGHSTLAAADSVTGYGLGDGTRVGHVLDFDGNAVAAANVVSAGVTGYTSGELTYAITNGLMTFAGTAAAGLTVAQKANVAQLVVTAANAAVAFTDGTDSYVFHNDATADSLVKLIGVTALGLGAAATTNGYVNVG